MPKRPVNSADPTEPAALPTRQNPVLQAAAATAGMVLFALAAHTPLPTFSLAIAGLGLTALAISASFSTLKEKAPSAVVTTRRMSSYVYFPPG